MSIFNNITELKENARRQQCFEHSASCGMLLQYLHEVNKIIPEKNIAYVYPIKLIGDKVRNWNENDLKIVIFTKDKKIITVIDDNLKNMKIEFYDKDDINSIILNVGKAGSISSNEYNVKISFKNGIDLLLSRDDAIESLQEEYVTAIAEILQFLSSSNH